jgi:hypothetical protein
VITDFLRHLGDAATSTIALVAYIVVILAWALRTWLIHRPMGKIEKLLDQCVSDEARIEMAGKITGSDPPKGLRKKDLLRWVTLHYKHRSRLMATAAYMATLLTIVIIVGMALYQSSGDDERKPPVLVDTEVVE